MGLSGRDGMGLDRGRDEVERRARLEGGPPEQRWTEMLAQSMRRGPEKSAPHSSSPKVPEDYHGEL